MHQVAAVFSESFERLLVGRTWELTTSHSAVALTLMCQTIHVSVEKWITTACHSPVAKSAPRLEETNGWRLPAPGTFNGANQRSADKRKIYKSCDEQLVSSLQNIVSTRSSTADMFNIPTSSFTEVTLPSPKTTGGTTGLWRRTWPQAKWCCRCECRSVLVPEVSFASPPFKCDFGLVDLVNKNQAERPRVRKTSLKPLV